MKLSTIAIVLLFSAPVFAGGYYSLNIDSYDPASGFYYKSISSEKESGFLSSNGGQETVNLNIYDPSTGSAKLLFPQQAHFQIISLLFETEVTEGKVSFYSDYSSSIKNNTNIALRAVKPTMLILTLNTETKLHTFYFANKDGSKLIKGKSFAGAASWHLDVKNSKVRIVKQVDKRIEIDSFNW